MSLWKMHDSKKKTRMKKIILFIIFVVFISPSFADFISSKTSKVFHDRDCRYAQSLNDENADVYIFYSDAINDGLRKCSVCNPQPGEESDPDPDPDPNDVVEVLPPKIPTVVIPINGMAIQMNYCKYPYKAEGIGEELVVQDQFPISIENAKNKGLEPCPIFPAEDPNSIYNPNEIVYTSHISKFYHKEDCERFKGVELSIISREKRIKATNNATWYPETGVISWRITPFEMGDYVAIANSDVGQAEFIAITVRPLHLPSLQDVSDIWLKGNFDMQKYGEWAGNNALMLPPRNNNNIRISWVFEDGKWIPYNEGRVLVETENEIIDEITTRTKTTKIYEKPISGYSSVWEIVKKEITEFTVIQYVREGDIQLSTSKSFSINIGKDSYDNEEAFLESKPVPPTRPDPNAIDKEEERLKSLMDIKIFKPIVEEMLASSSPQKTYEEKLVKYGAEYAEYEKKLKMWEDARNQIEEEKAMEEAEHLRMYDREDRTMEEMMFIQEERKTSVIEELIEDERITDEQKGTLREILNAIRENP